MLKHDGMSQNVCKPSETNIVRGHGRSVAGNGRRQVLGLADKLDTIVAFFQAGIIPKGSEDPFA
jgi:glycyl-tRNA synthetase beta subunit